MSSWPVREYEPTPVPKKLCNTDRLFAALADRDIDGVVAFTGQNSYYLSSLAAHKSAPELGGYYAVVLSRSAPDHPVLIAADLDLAKLAYQPTWIEDIRSYATLLLPLDAPLVGDELLRFAPGNVLDSHSLRSRYHGSLLEGVVQAMKDLGLTSGAIAFDNLAFANQVNAKLPDITPLPGDGVLRYVRAEKTPSEIELLRESTRINQLALERTVSGWTKGMTWLDLSHLYHVNALSLGGFIDAPGAMEIANPEGSGSAWHANSFLDDFELSEGTNIMFDCHGRYKGYCWDGGKTWVVGGESSKTTERAWNATTAAMEEIQTRLAPGQLCSEAVAIGRATFEKFGYSTDGILIFFHGLGLDHLDQEDGGRSDWRFIENMVISTHIVFPGGDRDRVFMEDIAVVKRGAPDRFFTWGRELMTQ